MERSYLPGEKEIRDNNPLPLGEDWSLDFLCRYVINLVDIRI